MDGIHSVVNLTFFFGFGNWIGGFFGQRISTKHNGACGDNGVHGMDDGIFRFGWLFYFNSLALSCCPFSDLRTGRAADCWLLEWYKYGYITW